MVKIQLHLTRVVVKEHPVGKPEDLGKSSHTEAGNLLIPLKAYLAAAMKEMFRCTVFNHLAFS